MNGLALGGFLQGQRLADEDWRTEQRFPLTQEQLMLANQGAGLQNNRYAQETPLHLTGMQQQNEARGMQNARYAQETPLHIAGMGLQNTGRELQNSGQTLQNSRYQQETPLHVNSMTLQNTGNQQINDKRAIDLNTTRQLQPTQNALALQQNTQALAAGGINQGIQAYRTTGNIGALKQAIDGAHGGNVQIAPLPDGSVHVKDPHDPHDPANGVSNEQTFPSMDEFLGVVAQTAAPAAKAGSKPGENWVSIGNGWIADKYTGETQQIYQERSPANMPMKDADLTEQAAGYVGNLGLDLSTQDQNMLALDVQANAKALMQQGVNPSLALQQAYDAVKGGVSGESAFIGNGQKYTPGGSLALGANPLSTQPAANAQPAAKPAYQLPANIPPELKAEAEAAISRGISPDKVMQRIKQAGY